MPDPDQLLAFFKALADASRLRILGLLADRAHSVEELATALDLRPSTVSHHVSRLAAAGLVSGRVEGHYHVYALDREALEEKAREMLATRALTGTVPEGHAYDRKVLAAFVGADGRFKALPMQRKKLEVLLRHTLSAFEAGGTWSELEVNNRLRAFSDDVATLRRGLVDTRMMTRDRAGTRYGLAAAE